MNQGKKLILGMMILAIFILVVSVSSFYVQLKISDGDVCGCAIPLPLFIPFLASIGLFIGTLLYHFFYPRTESNIDKKVLLMLFDSAEREILSKIIECDGRCLQSKITRETNLSKVQVFRTLESLVKRKIVTKESVGKTNIIKLEKDISKLLE